MELGRLGLLQGKCDYSEIRINYSHKRGLIILGKVHLIGF